MSDTEADFELARRAVDRGWLRREEVEDALRSSRPIRNLLTADQIRSLDAKTPPEAADAMLDPANRCGRYWRIRKLGSGGMGTVWLAWDPTLGRPVAVKLLKAIGDETARAFFRREAQLAAALDHPNIAKIYEVGESDDGPFIAMQYIDGTTLGAARLLLPAKVAAVATIAEAVAYAHSKGIIHRDLKPSNVMLDAHGRVFVMDFGLAKETNAAGLTETNTVLGTPNYMAPEQAKGRAVPASDAYSIAAILYEMATGRPPFVGETSTEILMQVISVDPILPRKLAPGIPPDLEAVIVKGLEKEIPRRYDLASLREDLARLQANEPLRHARRATWSYVLGKRIRKQPLLWGLSTALVLAVLAGVAFGIYGLVEARREAQEKARVEKRRRDEADRQAAIAREGLAYGYHLRARSAVQTGELPTALLLYAEAHALSPSPLYAAAGSMLSRAVPPLRRILPVEPIALSEDGSRAAVVAGTEVRILDTNSGAAVGEPWKADGAVELSPDGRRAVAMGRASTVLWDGRPTVVPRPTRGVAFHGSLAALHQGDRIVFYDFATQLPFGDDVPQEGEFRHLAFSPDGRLLAAGGGGGALAVIDVEKRRVLVGRKGAMGWIHRVGFLDGARLLTLGNLNPPYSVRILDSGTLEPVGKAFEHYGDPGMFATSPDGKRLVLAESAGRLRIRDLTSGEPLATLSHPSEVRDVRWSGTSVVTACEDGLARLWRGDEVLSIRHAGPVKRIRASGSTLVTESDGLHLFELREDPFVLRLPADLLDLSPDGNLGLARDDKPVALRLWRPSGTAVLAHDFDVAGGRISPDGRIALTWGAASQARLWSLETGMPVGDAVRHASHAHGGTFSPDGSVVAISPSVTVTELRSTRDGRSIAVLRHADPVRKIGFSGDGRRLLAVGDRGRVESFETASGRLISSGIWHALGHGAPTILSSPGGERAVLGLSGPLVVWDADEGRKLRDLPDALLASDLAPDHARFATLGPEGARIWTLATGEPAGDLVPHRGAVAFAWHPREPIVAVASSDGRAQAWNTANGSRIAKALVQEGSIRTLAWSPDGRWLATGARDRTVRLWDPILGEPVGIPLRHPNEIERVAFTSDGLRLIAVSGDGLTTAATHLWDVGFLRDGFTGLPRLGLRLGARGEVEFLPTAGERR